MLALGLCFAARGSLRGYVIFLGYVGLFDLSLYTLVGGLAGVDAVAVYENLHGRISPIVYSGFLWVIAVGLALLWLGDLVLPMVDGTPPTIVEERGEQATVSHAIDLAVVVPALAIAGYWLLQGRPWGYVFDRGRVVARSPARVDDHRHDRHARAGRRIYRLDLGDRLYDAPDRDCWSARDHGTCVGLVRSNRIGRCEA